MLREAGVNLDSTTCAHDARGPAGVNFKFNLVAVKTTQGVGRIARLPVAVVVLMS